MSQHERILCITKFRYIGDTVLAIPAIRALSHAYPKAKISLLTGAGAAEVVKGCPYIHKVIPYDRYGDGKSFTSMRKIARELKAQKFDLAALFNRSFHCALLAKMARIKKRAGHNVEHRGLLLTTKVPYDLKKTELDTLLDISSACGAPPFGENLELWVTDKEKKFLLQKFELENYERMIVIQPGANDPNVRQWPTTHWVETILELQRESGAHIVIVGAKSEENACGALAQRLPFSYTNLCGQTELRELLGIISAAKIFLGADTGVMHCAVALGTPTVGVYGPTKAFRWGHDSDHNKTLFTPSSSDEPSEEEIRKCLDSVTSTQMVKAAWDLLDRSAQIAK